MTSPHTQGAAALYAGRLKEAQQLLEAALAEEPDRVDVRRDLGMAYYRANDFARAAEVSEPLAQMAPFVAQLRSFGDDAPYERHGPARTTLPFLLTDPLPVVQIGVEGTEIYALIDTGGGQLILDTELADELGVARFGESEGSFGGGLKAPVGHGRVERVTLGDIELRRVPVQLLPTRRFSPITGGRYQLDAVIGTNLLAQFRPTLDYPGEQLVLEQPGASEEIEGAEVPFELHGDHYMFAEGSLNGIEGLWFFVDSGLAGGAFMCSEQTLERAGIPVPEARIAEGSVGGGGGVFPTGVFEVAELGLGALRQQHLIGVYSPTAPSEEGPMPRMDGLISHGFLRKYRWTIDFARSVFVFG